MRFRETEMRSTSWDSAPIHVSYCIAEPRFRPESVKVSARIHRGTWGASETPYMVSHFPSFIRSVVRGPHGASYISCHSGKIHMSIRLDEAIATGFFELITFNPNCAGSFSYLFVIKRAPDTSVLYFGRKLPGSRNTPGGSLLSAFSSSGRGSFPCLK